LFVRDNISYEVLSARFVLSRYDYGFFDARLLSQGGFNLT
jgi:hypothetical protein